MNHAVAMMVARVSRIRLAGIFVTAALLLGVGGLIAVGMATSHFYPNDPDYFTDLAILIAICGAPGTFFLPYGFHQRGRHFELLSNAIRRGGTTIADEDIVAVYERWSPTAAEFRFVSRDGRSIKLGRDLDDGYIRVGSAASARVQARLCDEYRAQLAAGEPVPHHLRRHVHGGGDRAHAEAGRVPVFRTGIAPYGTSPPRRRSCGCAPRASRGASTARGPWTQRACQTAGRSRSCSPSAAPWPASVSRWGKILRYHGDDGPDARERTRGDGLALPLQGSGRCALCRTSRSALPMSAGRAEIRARPSVRASSRLEEHVLVPVPQRDHRPLPLGTSAEDGEEAAVGGDDLDAVDAEVVKLRLDVVSVGCGMSAVAHGRHLLVVTRTVAADIS